MLTPTQNRLLADPDVTIKNKISLASAQLYMGSNADVRDAARIIAKASREKITIKSIVNMIKICREDIAQLREQRRKMRRRTTEGLHGYINTGSPTFDRLRAYMRKFAASSDVPWATKNGYGINMRVGVTAGVVRTYNTYYGGRYPRRYPVYNVTWDIGAFAANREERQRGGKRFFITRDKYVTMTKNWRIKIITSRA